MATAVPAPAMTEALAPDLLIQELCSNPHSRSPFPFWERKEAFPGWFSEENGAHFPVGFHALALTGVAMGWLLNIPIPQLFLDQGKHQLCPPVGGLGAWMLPSDPEADRTEDTAWFL